MKNLIFSLLFCGALAYAQSTTFYTWNLQVSPTDTAVPIPTTLDGAVATANYLFHNSTGQTTLTAACASAATSCTVAGPVAVGNGICFSTPCAVTATATGGPPPTVFSLSGGEVALVTAVSGTGPYTVTLKRASIGTAVAGTSGQAVTILAAGSYTQQTANFVLAALAPIVVGINNGAYTVTTQTAIITAAQAVLATVH